MSANEAQHTLLSLPAEVKQNILGHLLCAELPVHIYNTMSGLFAKTSAIDNSVLYTCHDLYEHGRLVLYRQNHFILYHPPFRYGFNENWLVGIGSHDVAYLSSVETEFHMLDFGIKNAVHFHERRAEMAEYVQGYVQSLALFHVPITVNTGLRHLHMNLNYLNSPVHLATLMRALVTLPQLMTLELTLTAVPLIWLLYLNQRLRVPVSYRCKLFRWNPVRMFRRLEHRMRLAKQFEVHPVDRLPPDWVESDAYRAIIVPTFTDNGDWQVPVLDPSHLGTFDYTIGVNRWVGTLPKPREVLPVSDVTNHTISSVLSGVESLMGEQDLVSGRYTPAEFHAREYELARLQHEYLQSVWDEFKGMGLLERKPAQEQEQRVLHVLNEVNHLGEKNSLAEIMRSLHSKHTPQFISSGYDDILPFI